VNDGPALAEGEGAGGGGDDGVAGPAGFTVRPAAATAEGSSGHAAAQPHFDLSRDGLEQGGDPAPPTAVVFDPPPVAPVGTGAAGPWRQSLLIVAVVVAVLVGAWACLLQI
jgi:hypothetical protein